MRRRKTYKQTNSKKRKTFGRGKKKYSTLETAAFILEVVFLLEHDSQQQHLYWVQHYSKKYLKKMRRKDNYRIMKRATAK